MAHDRTEPGNTPRYFRVLLRFLRPFPDFDFGFITSVRAHAADLLALQPGDRALDVGCGPGGSLTYLRRAVGETGEVVGVEISGAVAEQARRRIAHHGWRNVSVNVSPAQSVPLTGVFHGLLMFAAPDVYASPAAWDNLRPYLAPHARVVFFGAKTSARRGGWLLNGLLQLMPRLSFATTPAPDSEPWRMLAPSLEALQVREYFFGWMFLASGTLKRSQ